MANKEFAERDERGISEKFGYYGQDQKWHHLLFCTYDLFNRDFVGRIKFMNMLHNWIDQGGHKTNS